MFLENNRRFGCLQSRRKIVDVILHSIQLHKKHKTTSMCAGNQVKEAPRREPIKRGPLKREPLNREPLKRKPLKREPIKCEPLKREHIETNVNQ